MSEKKNTVNKLFNTLFFLAAAVAAVYYISQNPRTFANIALALIGFGATIFIHELGHFLVAKAANIKCYAFSLGFPPTLLGVRNTAEGLRFRLLPKFFPKEGQTEEEKKTNDEDGGRLNFTLNTKCRPSDTEYRIGLIPFGGFVGMLGQEDADVAKATEDPRSFTNKPVSVRMAVTIAGVLFNLFGALAAFTLVASVGVRLSPAVVGYVSSGSAAEKAGLVAGDEVIEIDGTANPDFTDLMLTGALSGKGQEVEMKVLHENGSTQNYKITAEKTPGTSLRGFGIGRAQDLKIATLRNAEELYDRIGLQAGDELFAVDGKAVTSVWQLNEAIEGILKPNIALSAKRVGIESQETEIVQTTVALDLVHGDSYRLESETELANIYSIVPRLRITSVAQVTGSRVDRIRALAVSLLEKFGINKWSSEDYIPEKPALEGDDIVVKIGDVDWPTYFELRQVIREHSNKKMPMTVLRRQEDGSRESVHVEVTPYAPSENEQPVIGITVALDAETCVVAKTIAGQDGPDPLEIPRGATIISVDGTKVANFYDVIDIIRSSAGERIPIQYRLDNQVAGVVAMDVPSDKDYINVKSMTAEIVPFDDLRRTYKESNIFKAAGVGLRRVKTVVAQSYVTVKALIAGRLGADNLTGPIGIAHISYRIVAAKEFTYYIYFLGMISCYLAVINFLPIPIVDGGVFVLLIIEKLKGSPVSERIQQVVVYVGLAMIGSLFIYVTFNDFLNWLLPK